MLIEDMAEKLAIEVLSKEGQQYSVVIRRNSDGLERTFYMDHCPCNKGTYYWWTFGNMGCDCNLYAIFEDCQDFETPCSDHLYTVVKLIFDDGEEVPIIKQDY